MRLVQLRLVRLAHG